MSTSNAATGEIRNYWLGLQAAWTESTEQALADMAALLLAAHQRGATVWTSGSAAADMTESLLHHCAVLGRAGVASVCLPACPNARMSTLKAAAHRGDVLCIFAEDGACDSTVSMAEYAKANGLQVIGFLGGDGDRLLPLCECAVCFSASNAQSVRDLHRIGVHAVTASLAERLKDAWGMEVIFPPVPGRVFQFALFDFDGTLSLIREGWQKVMIPYFCEEIFKTPVGKTEDPQAVEDCVTEFVDLLTGKQTIYQCIRLAEEVEKRGGTPEDPMAYKTEYLRRLMEKIKDRREGLANGSITPESLLVRGTVPLLEALKRAGVTLYLASGTDQPQVREEAALLGLDKYFDGNIYGALDEHVTSCTKELVIKRLLAENNLDGTELLSFGDGFVEIELVSNLGGYPVAVATDESRKMGIDQWKRDRLVKAGAGTVIPDFECAERLVDFILGR